MAEILLGEQRGKGRQTADPDQMARHAGRVFAAGSLILVVGVAIDLFTLWVLQRQDTVQWEFTALGTTTNSFPLLVLGTALFYGALVFWRTSSAMVYRLTAAVVLLLGLFGLLVAFLLGTNYLAIMQTANVPPEAAAIFRSIMLKGLTLSTLFGVVMGLAGLLGLRIRSQAVT